MKKGKCELCHLVRDLHDSHFLPRGGYKRTRAKVLKNPNPMILSGGKIKQSSRQVSDYKFCTECEARLNNGGENSVLSVVPADYGEKFKIHDRLRGVTPIVVRDGFLLFRESSISAIDLQSLIYFGMSIFWRATLRWSPVDGGSPPQLLMNLRQKEAIRNFLLGKAAALPRDLALTVAIWPFDKVSPMNFVPTQDSESSYRRYWFYFSGFLFFLALSKRIPAHVKRTCAYRSKVLTLSVELGQYAWDIMRKQILSADRSTIDKTLQEIKEIRSKTSSKE